MRLVEIRDLDGPNLFLLEPAIKVELALDGAPLSAVEALGQTVLELHQRAGADLPRITVAEMETPGQATLAFSWDHRRFALGIADAIARIATGETGDLSDAAARLREIRAECKADDAPLMIRDTDRRMRAIAVTGTNGKTTTTRLIAHIGRVAGLRVGWCSSAGVYINGAQVVEGDYSGPSGARRVLTEPGLDLAVLETARGGILLRGVAYESNDVGVFINVSADHLDLQGIRTVRGLARVKSIVARVTRPEGYAVLNADDPLVLAVGETVRARRFLVSRDERNPAVLAHVAAGGRALVATPRELVHLEGGERATILPLSEVPITFGGRAWHMVENALCAAAACLGIGLDMQAICEGLRTFRNTPSDNPGRLNVFRVGGASVILDYAHNEAGLDCLLDFAETLKQPGGRVISIIGTAGDRTAESLRELGRIAARRSEVVIVKGTKKYLRGRNLEELIGLYVEGIENAGATPYAIEPLELPATERALEIARPGDVIAIMAQEQIEEIVSLLQGRGQAVEALST